MPSIFLSLGALLLCQSVQAITLPGIPTIDFNVTSSSSTFDLASVTLIVVDEQYQDATDDTGQTLIPPTLAAFAQTFSDDYANITGSLVSVETGSAPVKNSIFLTITANDTEIVDAAGRPTAEGYTLDVTSEGVTITGASPLGVWWGTRSLLQQAVLTDRTLPVGSGRDAPGWGTRGIMLDVARHYYPAPFLVSLCNYISFFKQNTLHIHLSDNLFNYAQIYSREESLNLYATFRLNSDEPAVAGLVKPWRVNETYTREQFDDVQTQCAARGVTVIPEIEAPGHALVISQWKPEIGLTDLSLLNLTHPDTMPTMKDIWNTFLPWFHSKTVHIGADEYDSHVDDESAFADDYIRFVNTMADHIAETSGKETRIWGTDAPSNTSSVNTTVSIQHWAAWETVPRDLLEQGHNVVNSDDGAYIVTKWSEWYPQKLNLTRIFNGNPAGGAFAPFVFDTNNATNNPPRDHPGVLGHIAAQWNDWGLNASTYGEAYYSWREGIAGLADKQWGGKLTLDQYNEVWPLLHSVVPEQNLDATVPSKTDTIFEYDFSKRDNGSAKFKDLSGNAYHATCSSSCPRAASDKSIALQGEASITTPLTTRGRDYTLSFSVNVSPSSPIGSPLFTGADSVLQHGNGTNPQLMLITSVNQPYALNYTLPTDVWTNVQLIGRGNATFLSVDGGEEMQFLTKMWVNGRQFLWKEIAIEAPIERMGGGGFVGRLANVTLVASA